MPKFENLKKAREYGSKNYMIPNYKQSIHGNWIVTEGYGQGIKEVKNE